MSAWLAAGAFFAAAMACLLRGLQRADAGWHAAGALLCLLAVVQVSRLDLAVTAAIRSLAWQDGWYAMRRPLQVTALAVGMVALAAGAFHMRREPLLAAGLGVCLLAAWARIVSLHHVDLAMDARMLGMSWGRWIDAAGLALVFMGAFRRV